MEDELKLCEWSCSIPCRCILGSRHDLLAGQLVNLSYDRVLVVPKERVPKLGSSIGLVPETEGEAVLLYGRVVFVQGSQRGIFGIKLFGCAEENCFKLQRLLPFVSCPTSALMPGTSQRRKFGRWSLSLPVSLQWENEEKRGSTLDLSLTGARVRVLEAPPRGSEIELWFPSTEEDALVGKVIHGIREAECRAAIGIEFSEGYRGFLLSLIRDQIESHSRLKML